MTQAESPEVAPEPVNPVQQQHLGLFAALAAPFDEHEVKTRPQGGKNMPYITSRTVMNRLDSVAGPAFWWDEYRPRENSVECTLSILLPDGRVLSKTDAGGYAGMSDSGDDEKSGYADAFKRAAVKFGVGRYLYRDGYPEFAAPYFERQEPPRQEPKRQEPHGNGNSGGNGGGQQQGNGGGRPSGPPTSGRAMFAWTKEQEQKHNVKLLNYLNGWAKLQDFPGRMVDWTAEQVALGHKEATRKLASVAPSDRGEAYEEALAN